MFLLFVILNFCIKRLQISMKKVPTLAGLKPAAIEWWLKTYTKLKLAMRKVNVTILL